MKKARYHDARQDEDGEILLAEDGAYEVCGDDGERSAEECGDLYFPPCAVVQHGERRADTPRISEETMGFLNTV